MKTWKWKVYCVHCKWRGRRSHGKWAKGEKPEVRVHPTPCPSCKRIECVVGLEPVLHNKGDA